MTMTIPRERDFAEEHRTAQYNAQVVGLTRCHDELMRMRVRPDQRVPPFLAGQYTVLGLGEWEQPVEEGASVAKPGIGRDRLIKRAYSISCPLLDAQGTLIRPTATDFWEFYIRLVHAAADGHTPALTPRLFGMSVGDRIFCGPHARGNYTLREVQRDDNVVFAATGTGEAPHNAMVAELLADGHRGRMVSVTCVRWKEDLGYLAAHRILAERFENYRYLPLTTREPENVDNCLPTFVGKRYLQDYFRSGDLERDADIELSPGNTHVFLCGNPKMIGIPKHTADPARRYPDPAGMVEVLESKGFHVDRPRRRGNIHFEKYW